MPRCAAVRGLDSPGKSWTSAAEAEASRGKREKHASERRPVQLPTARRDPTAVGPWYGPGYVVRLVSPSKMAALGDVAVVVNL